VLLGLICVVLLAVPAGAEPVGAEPAAAEAVDIVWITFESPAELASLAQVLDVWEVQDTLPAGAEPVGSQPPGAGRLKALVSDADRVWLAGRGFEVETVAPAAVTPSTIPSTSCYRTIDELYAQLPVWALDYPTLTELRSLGTSYEGRPIYALRLTNEATGPAKAAEATKVAEAAKPIFFLMANIHGRELITPEMAMVFIEHLLTGYGVDADVTWLLDHHLIEVMVSANPDGHVRNEAGQPWAYWRKNANPTYGYCGGLSYGIDLNRNSGFLWGGASTDPCYPLYQGPSPVSEVETQVVETFLHSLFPDERPDGLTTRAPESKPGVFITLHSYGDLVLWPWGHTYTPSPNSAGLSQLGRKMASYNGYAAKQASGLYPTTGTTDDFAYGELGVASYTFEIGSSNDGFYPPCYRLDALTQPNLDALLYAAKVARVPYQLPAGPDAADVVALSVVSGAGQAVSVTALIDDRGNGGQDIAAAEAYIDVPPWDGGQSYPLDAVDGLFDAAHEVVSGTLLLDTISPGRHLVFVRGQDAEGAWGPVSADFVTVAYGLDLAPVLHVGAARPGEVVTYALALTNTGTLSQTFTLTHTHALWPVSLVPTITHQTPGSGTVVTASVTIPSGLAGVTRDVFTVTARADEAPWLLREARIETHGLWVSVFLPSVMRVH